MNKIVNRLKSLIPSKRKLIQLYSALLFNANIKGFFNGKIYQGSIKIFAPPVSTATPVPEPPVRARSARYRMLSERRRRERLTTFSA